MDKRMTLAEAKAWLGDRWVLAHELKRLDHRPPPTLRPVPEYLRDTSLPMFLRYQAA